MSEPTFTPERATRYVADSLPGLLARAAAQLGEGDAPVASPSARAARLALLSAREILDQLGAIADEAVVLPHETALARLERRFRDRHPQLPLAMPTAGPRDLAARVAAAWEEASDDAPPPAPAIPGPGLPARGSGLDL